MEIDNTAKPRMDAPTYSYQEALEIQQLLTFLYMQYNLPSFPWLPIFSKMQYVEFHF